MIKKQDFLYLVGVILVIARTYIDNSEFAKIIQIYDIVLLPMIITLFFLKIIDSKYGKKEFLIIIMLFVLCLIASVLNSKYVILMSFVALISLKGVDVKKVVNVIFYTNCAFLFLYTVIYFVKLNVSPDSFEFTLFYKGKVRHAFFFNHPNFYSGIVFWTLAEFLYLKNDKVKVWDYMFIILVGYLAFYYTQTRTLLVCLSILIVFKVFTDLKSVFFDNIIKSFVKYGFPVFSILFIILTVSYFGLLEDYPEIIEKVDRLLSRRISFSAIINQQYDFSLLPQKVNYSRTFSWNNKYNFNLTLDNIYVQCSMVHGICFLIIFSLIFYHSSKIIKEKNDYIFMAMVIITGVVESYILNCCICFPIILMVSRIMNNEKKFN